MTQRYSGFQKSWTPSTTFLGSLSLQRPWERLCLALAFSKGHREHEVNKWTVSSFFFDIFFNKLTGKTAIYLYFVQMYQKISINRFTDRFSPVGILIVLFPFHRWPNFWAKPFQGSAALSLRRHYSENLLVMMENKRKHTKTKMQCLGYVLNIKKKSY